MPNLYNPEKFNMFGFIKEIKAIKNHFVLSTTNQTLPFNNVDVYTTDTTAPMVSIKVGTNENEIFGAMRLSHYTFRGADYKVIERVCTTEKHRSNGIMKLLYSHCLELGLNLMTGSTHTTFGSKDFWIKAKEYFPKKSMYVVNLSTQHKRLYTDQPEHSIWGKEPDEDFDIRDKDNKLYLLEGLRVSKVLSAEQFEYFNVNIDKLADRKNVRLTLE
jgi:predicted GNAT family N-acyltransferase